MTKIRLVLLSGWLFIVSAAGIILPPIESRGLKKATLPLFAHGCVWAVLTITALAVYLYRSWRRVAALPNRRPYFAFVTVGAVCLLTIFGGLLWLRSISYVTSPRWAREKALQQDLLVMRSEINQYVIDKQKPLHSLDDLVTSGYLRKVPVDPMTGRDDTWVLKCSDDAPGSGIVDIESGYGASPNPRFRCD